MSGVPEIACSETDRSDRKFSQFHSSAGGIGKEKVKDLMFWGPKMVPVLVTRSRSKGHRY